MTTPDLQAAVNEQLFRLRPVGMRFFINPEIVRDEETIALCIGSRLRFRARVGVWKDFQHYCKHPRNWKEAFKERWFPTWLLKRFPVLYDQHEHLTSVVYDLADLRIPDGMDYQKLAFMSSFDGEIT